MHPDPGQLAAIPLFDSLSDDGRREIATWFQLRRVSEGNRLTDEGGFGYSFFILQDGAAVVTSGGEQRATLGPGDFFAEMAILGDGRRRATVTATSDVTLLVLFGTEFRRLQQELPDTAARIEKTMSDRLASMN